MDRFQYGIYEVNSDSRVAKWMQLKKLAPSKETLDIQTKPTDFNEEIMDRDFSDDQLMKKVKSSPFAKTWIGKWLITKVNDDRQTKEAKTLWSEFCFSFADSILKLESENLTGRDTKVDFRIYVMKQMDSMYFSSRPVLTTLHLRSNPTVPDPQIVYQNIMQNIQEYIYQTKSQEQNAELILDPTYEAMDQVAPQNPFETKSRTTWTSGNRRPTMVPESEIQNPEFISVDHDQEIPISRITKKKLLKKDIGDPFALVREEFS